MLSIGDEQWRCGRRYQKGTANWDGQATSGVGFSTPVTFAPAMASTPSISETNSSVYNFSTTTGTPNLPSVRGYYSIRTATGTGAGQFASTWIADADL